MQVFVPKMASLQVRRQMPPNLGDFDDQDGRGFALGGDRGEWLLLDCRPAPPARPLDNQECGP